MQSGYNGKNIFVSYGDLKGRKKNVACVLGRAVCFSCGALIIYYNWFIRRIDGQNGVVKWLDGQPRWIDRIARERLGALTVRRAFEMVRE